MLGLVAAYALTGAGEFRWPVSLLSLAAAATLALGLLVRVGPLVQTALSLLAVAYALRLLGTGGIDLAAPLVAAAFLLVGELAYTCLEPPVRRAWPLVAALAAGAAVVATLLLAVATVSGGGFLALVAGVAAAAGALALVARLAATAPR